MSGRLLFERFERYEHVGLLLLSVTPRGGRREKRGERG